MAPRDKSRFWRKCRILFRRFRITVLSITLALLGALLYLNQVGLPGFIKRPLLEKLRGHGIELQFSRLRWRWAQGIVAENVRFGGTHEGAAPEFTARQAQLQIDQNALAHLQFQVNGLVLQDGRFAWTMANTNEPPRTVSVEKIQTELRLLPGDLWELGRFEAQFAGASFQLTGVITNASAVRDWKFFHPEKPVVPGALDARLRRLADLLEKIRFSRTPHLRMDVRGDARDLRNFAVRIHLSAPDADTPWGTLQHGVLIALLQPSVSNELSRAKLNLRAEGAQTRWANATNLSLTLHLFAVEGDTNMIQADLDLTATNVASQWGQTSDPHLTAQWFHSITNPLPLFGHCQLETTNIQSQWGDAALLNFTCNVSSATNVVPTDETWAWWAKLAPCVLDWNCQLEGLQSPKLIASNFNCSGEWRAPVLALTNLSSVLYGGKLKARAEANVATREFTFHSSSDFDAQQISPLLTEKSREWLSQFSWIDPPIVQAEGSLILPAWTNRQPDWRAEVRPTVSLDGDFRIGVAAFRGVPFNYAASHFAYSNLLWRLPELIAVRPEGKVILSHESNETTRDYYFRVHSTIDPRAIRPLLDPAQQRGFDLVHFIQAPEVDAELWGRWYEHERIGGKGSIIATNFEIRGQSIRRFQTDFSYTNGFILCTNPRGERGESEHASATSLGVDIPARKIYLTNGFGTVDPKAVCRMIGTNVTKIMEPYEFFDAPTARVEGIIPMQDSRDADLHFELDGGPFTWWQFRIPHVSGRVDWVGDHLVLTNIQAQFYKGLATGAGDFDFHKEDGTDFRFDVVATDSDFHLLMSDLLDKTNRLEGVMTGRLAITRGNSVGWQTNLQGSGYVTLSDGLIWEIPIFGILSPALDSIAPGLGSARASEGSANFTIKNGVIRSDDLQIKASMMRLQYWGSVSLRNRVNVRVQAELLRDTWVVGRVLSFALWPVSKLFEYKITGNLHDPKSEPVFFIPRIVLMPFHPPRNDTKGPAPQSSPFSSTNAPPKNSGTN